MNFWTSLVIILGLILPLAQTSKPDRSPVALEIRLAEFEPAPGLIKAKTEDPRLDVYLHEEPFVTNKDILEARIESDPVPAKANNEIKVSDRPVYQDSDPPVRIRLK